MLLPSFFVVVFADFNTAVYFVVLLTDATATFVAGSGVIDCVDIVGGYDFHDANVVIVVITTLAVLIHKIARV